MNDHDLRPLIDFRSEIREPDAETARRIYRVATRDAARDRGIHRQRNWTRRPRLLLATGAVALGIAGAAGAVTYHYLDSSSPGLSAGFSAFDQLPPVTSLPPDFFALRGHTPADMVGVSIPQFEQRTRLLQSGLTLGPRGTHNQGQLYAYIGNNGVSCLLLAGQGATCITQDNAAHTNPYFPGVIPQVFPGNPGDTPVVTALVADNVSSINLVIEGRSTDVPIIHNSIYADLTSIKRGDSIALDATYGDGTSRTFTLMNPANAN